MAKSKPKRSLAAVGKSQQQTESSSRDKFADAEGLAKPKVTKVSPAGRISPQLSCTIAPEDMAMLTELGLYLSQKNGRMLKASNVIRSLIRYGYEHKDRLEI